MAGSALAGRLLAPSLNIRVERYMQAVFAVSAVALFVPVIFNRTQATEEADSLKADAPGENAPTKGFSLVSVLAWRNFTWGLVCKGPAGG